LVEHSHAYSLRAEYRRNLAIGVFHRSEHWLIEEFGPPGGEGWRFVRSELRYLLQRNPLQIPSALLRTLVKYTAYQAGLHEWSSPPWLMGSRRLDP
jgi:rhamnosyltransferase